MHRGITVGVAVAVASAALFAAQVHAGSPWDGCPDAVNHFPDHVRIRNPRFSAGQPVVTSLAADPREPGRLAVSNGVDVQVSDDAGCTWRPAFARSRPGDHGAVSVVAYEGAHLRVLVVRRPVTVAGAGPVLLRLYARDDGAESELDLPPEFAASECSEARRCVLRFAPGGGLAVGYVATPGVNGLLPTMGVTADGGRTWTAQDAPGPVTDIAVDPRDDAHVLVLAGRVFRSKDRGASVVPVSAPRQFGNGGRVLFTRDGRSDAAIADASTDGTATTAVFVSRDDGGSFQPGVAVPAAPLRDVGMVPAPWGPAFAVAAGGRLLREGQNGGFDVVMGQGSAVQQVVPTTTGAWIRRAGAVAFVDTLAVPSSGDGRSRVSRPRTGGSPAGNLKGRAGGGRLHVDEVVQVPPEGTGATIVLGDLGRQPRGIDVFFLMDTSGSMAAKIAPMANAMGKVVDALNREGIAARFGLGEHGAASFRYRRHADLGTPPEEVRTKLATLTPSSGEEYHYTAFYQIATGEGMQARAHGGSIPPGQQASFEPGALHVIVHATDEPDNTDPEGPSETTALAALVDVDVHHIGIYPYDGGPRDTSNDTTTHALRRYAAGTSTFAPIGGLDCDGDGKVDLPEGEPIACAVVGSTSSDAPIASLLERVLLSLSSRQPVSVEDGPSPLDVEITPLGDYRAVDLHEPARGLRFRVQVTCPAEQRGADVEVPLELVVGGVAVATAPLRVTCLASPPPAPTPTTQPPPTRRPGPRVVPALPPVATGPPALAQSTATAQASSTASQSAQAQATQAGLALAPDEAAELARAEEDEVRFVAHRGMPSTAPAGAAVAVAFALLYAARPRVAVAVARTRDWRERW